jgi:hypothetical protein
VGKGIHTAVASEELDGGKTRFHAKLDPADVAKLDLGSDAVQSELERVLEDALRSS